MAEDVHAHHLGGDVLVADGDEGLAHPGAEEVLREPEVEDAGGHDEEEETPVVGEVDAEQARRGHADAADAAGDRSQWRR